MRHSGFFLILFLCAAPVFGGQSVILQGGRIGTFTVPNAAQYTGSSYVDLRIHNWSLPPAGCQQIFRMYGLIYLALCPASYDPAHPLQFIDRTDTVVNNAVPIGVPADSTDVLLRIHRDLVSRQLVAEVWDVDGSGYTSASTQLSSVGSLQPPLTGQMGDYGATVDVAFVRWYSGTIAVGAAPPRGDAGGDLGDWEFEGNTNDQSGNNLNVVLSPATTAPPARRANSTYAQTPRYPPVCSAVMPPLRAGVPATLDGTSSFPLDGGTSLQYTWQQIPSPQSPQLQNLVAPPQPIATPTISGLIAGPVDFQLTVTDGSGQSSSCTVQAGAVAADSRGNIIVGNPGVGAILGPMTVMGKNPWPWADQAQLQWVNRYGSWQGTVPPLGGTFLNNWQTPDPPGTPGTVSVTYGSNTLTGTNTTFGLTFCGSSAGFPCIPPQDELVIVWYRPVVTIASASATNPMVLTVNSPDRSFATLPVGQGGTLAISGASGAGCDGLNGLQAVKSIGAVFTSSPPGAPAGSTTFTIDYDGRGCSYVGASAAAVVPNITGRRLLTVQSVASDTQLTFAGGSIWNATAGTQSGLSYNIWTDLDLAYWGGNGSSFNNFYDSVLAFYETYYRTGLDTYLGWARWLANAWWTMPEIDRGSPYNLSGTGGNGTWPRSRSMAGMFLRALDQDQQAGSPGASPMWAGLRSFINTQVMWDIGYTAPKYPVGEREQYYEINELAMCALVDPDISVGGQRQMCLSVLDDALSGWLASQRRADGSWQYLVNTLDFYGVLSQSLNNPPVPPYVDVTHGSTTVSCSSGSSCGFDPSWFTYKIVAASGNPTVLTFTNVILGGTPPGVAVGSNISITGSNCSGMNSAWTVSSTSYDANGFYVTIPYNGAGCTYTGGATIAAPLNFWTTGSIMDAGASADPVLYTATYVDAQHLTISPAYQGATASARQWQLSHSWIGFGQQPFMLGILGDALTTAYNALSQATPGGSSPYDAALAAKVLGWITGIANWITTAGYASASKGLWYGVGFGVCNPPTNDWTCMEGSAVNNVGLRELSPEALGAIAAAYALNPAASCSASPLCQAGDNLYSGPYAKYASDPGYDGLYASDFDVGGWWWGRNAAKWLGFNWGFGRSYNWPAARQGGVDPPAQQTVPVALDLASVPNAASASIVVTQPSGAQSAFSCDNSAPCQVTIDARQGQHWISIQYLSNTGQAVGTPVQRLIP